MEEGDGGVDGEESGDGPEDGYALDSGDEEAFEDGEQWYVVNYHVLSYGYMPKMHKGLLNMCIIMYYRRLDCCVTMDML